MCTVKYHHNRWFTLVELIVVITILAILSTVAFLSFKGYSASARDSVRLSDLDNISKGLTLYSATSGSFPRPDNAITLKADASSSVLQGTAGSNVLRNLGMSDAKDGLDNRAYSYSTNTSGTKYALSGLLESADTLSAWNLWFFHAWSGIQRYLVLKWNGAGILTESGASGVSPVEQTNAAGATIDLSSTTKDLVFNITESNTIAGSGQIYGTVQMLQYAWMNYNAPKTCPSGYIPVAGNPDFNQPGFCVMKYEAKALWWALWPVTGTTYGTHDYSWGDVIVSNASDYPIASISQVSAIAACQSIGSGYHLLTENEWMTLARNIEKNPVNWTGNAVGNGYVQNGHVNGNPLIVLTASTNDADGYNGITALTGSTALRNNKRVLYLSSWEAIWDLSGNANEHVNKANTLDATGINLRTFSSSFSCDTPAASYFSWSWNDGNTECVFINGYSREKYGPEGLYNGNNGMGKLYSLGSWDGVRDNIFLRWGYYGDTTRAGLYSLGTTWYAGTANAYVGFRCAKY